MAQGTKQREKKRCRTQEEQNITGGEAGENWVDVIYAKGKEWQNER